MHGSLLFSAVNTGVAPQHFKQQFTKILSEIHEFFLYQDLVATPGVPDLPIRRG